MAERLAESVEGEVDASLEGPTRLERRCLSGRIMNRRPTSARSWVEARRRTMTQG
jgi:hypothetical protein